MARIRQQYPQNYGSSGNINTEFESITRYLNSAELGNNTIGELFGKIFDENGNWDGPIEFRKDSSAGIQYRVGEYATEAEGWVTLAALSDLRGEAGQAVGEIGAPIMFGRADYEATASQVDFEYSFTETDELLVYVDGVLQTEGALNDYTKDAEGGPSAAGLVTFNTGLTSGQVVTVFKIRATSITGYTRNDTLTAATQTNFPFSFDENTKLQVYKNGILQREGGTNDYTTIPAQNIIQFNTAVPAGNLVSIITVENTSVQAVTGMMFEENYVDVTTGLMRFDKMAVADGEIAQAKVLDLVSDLSDKAKLSVSANSPVSPVTGDLWHDVSQVPNQLKFYDGTQWLRTSPDSSLPTFTTGNAGQYVRVNGTGTALEYGQVDLSSVIKVNQKGVANGVAELDSTGRLPVAQLPSSLSSTSFYSVLPTASNGTYTIRRIFRQEVQIEAISVLTSSGSADVVIHIDGTDITEAGTFQASSVGTETVLGQVIQVVGTTNSHQIGFTVSNASSAANLEVTLAVTILS